jgi:DNA-binding XRE family transcriptional regulator
MRELLEIKQNRFKTEQALADFIGVSQPTINYWLSGEKVPSVKNANKLKALFGISLEKIFTPSDK